MENGFYVRLCLPRDEQVSSGGLESLRTRRAWGLPDRTDKLCFASNFDQIALDVPVSEDFAVRYSKLFEKNQIASCEFKPQEIRPGDVCEEKSSRVAWKYGAWKGFPETRLIEILDSHGYNQKSD